MKQESQTNQNFQQELKHKENQMNDKFAKEFTSLRASMV